MSGRPMPNGNRGKVGFIRPAVSPDWLAGAARKVEAMLRTLDGEGGCAVCGLGPHVEHCPVPALRQAAERLRFMAAVPVASTVPTRGMAS